LSRSDFVSLHLPGGKETTGLVNKEFLSHMKDDAVLINTARGSVINDADLLEKLEESKNFWYGADAYNNEPTKSGDFPVPLAQHPRVYGTHHIGASTKQSEAAIGEEAVRIIVQFAKTGAVDQANAVNIERDTSKLHKMSIRHLDKVGILAHAFKVFA
jgi:D-3-phosphoglycerate dehydrogenase